MRLQILTLLCSLVVLVLATGKLEDKSNIEDVLNSLSLRLDEKDYPKVAELFTKDGIYDEGPDGPRIQGIPDILDFLKKVIPASVTFSELTTKLIKFLPPFDKKGRSDRAEAVSYVTTVFFGSGNLTGESLFLFSKFVDKEIVRTKEPGFDGWRIKYRKLESIGKPIGNLAILEG